MKRKPKLHLVGQDPADIFDDLDRLRAEMGATVRRARTTETFARIPHDKGLALCLLGLGSAAWAILIELDRLILKAHGQNPVRLWSPRLRAIGIVKEKRRRGLHQLKTAKERTDEP